MTYVALKPLDMPDGSKRWPGDPVPEAKEWTNLRAWCMGGHVVFIADGTEGQFREAMVAGKDLTQFAPQAEHFQLLHAAAHLRHGIGAEPPPTSTDAQRDDTAPVRADINKADLSADKADTQDAPTDKADTDAGHEDDQGASREAVESTPADPDDVSKAAVKRPGGRFRR